MAHKAVNATRQTLRTLVRWISVQSHIARHCHACGTDVDCMTSVCPQCGASNPSKFSPAATAAILVCLGMLVAGILVVMI